MFLSTGIRNFENIYDCSQTQSGLKCPKMGHEVLLSTGIRNFENIYDCSQSQSGLKCPKMGHNDSENVLKFDENVIKNAKI